MRYLPTHRTTQPTNWVPPCRNSPLTALLSHAHKRSAVRRSGFSSLQDWESNGYHQMLDVQCSLFDYCWWWKMGYADVNCNLRTGRWWYNIAFFGFSIFRQTHIEYHRINHVSSVRNSLSPLKTGWSRTEFPFPIVECDDPQIIVIVELTPYRHQPTVVLHTSYVSVVHAAGLHSCKFLGIQKCGFFFPS